METITIHKENNQIDASEADLSGSKFHKAMLNNWDLNDVAMRNCKIVNADLSDLEIEGAQIGGAYIHNVGGPPVGHPAYNPDFKQRAVKFEDCNLNDCIITDCNLTNVTISDCNLSGAEIYDCDLSAMKINGILVEELLQAFNKSSNV